MKDELTKLARLKPWGVRECQSREREVYRQREQHGQKPCVGKPVGGYYVKETKNWKLSYPFNKN